MCDMVEGIPNVKVTLWDKLIVEYARNNDIGVIMRGVRAVDDFGYEFELSMLNKQLNNEVETIFLPTDMKYLVLRSSSIKELVTLGADVSKMIPPNVKKLLEEKLTSGDL